MTVNELLGKIEARIKELGKMKTRDLVYEHPDLMDGDAEGMKHGYHTARRILAGKSREDIIAEVVVEEFSTEFECTDLTEYQDLKSTMPVQ